MQAQSTVASLRRPRGRKSHFREEVVRMHREIFRRNRRAINSSVHGYSPAFRRYERQYARRVKSFRQRVSFDVLEQAIADCTVVYVGDYHTLPQAQRGCLRLIRRLPPARRVILGLEFVQGRYQRAVDAYLRGELSDKAFLAAIDHQRHWMFGGWESFKPFFELARARGYQVLALDSRGRGPAGATLAARDEYAARRIAKARRVAPNALTVVLYGELHVAPSHLPRQVHTLTRRDDPPHIPLVVYQNCEEIYWELERRGLEHDTEVVQISDNEFSLMNTPPIVCQQSFLNWLHAEDDGIALQAVQENFEEYVRLITSFFGLDLGGAEQDVEVATVADLSFLERLKRRGDFSNTDMRKIRAQIISSESYYIPRAKMIYLGNLSVNHAAEEATHFVRNTLSDSHEPRLLVDAFYWRVLEEAIGFLGSKLINHKRKCLHSPQLERLIRSKSTSTFDRTMARLVLTHERFLTGVRVRQPARVFECDADMFNAVTHTIGYQLGDRLYYALIGGKMAKSEVRELFFDSFSGEGDALSSYLYLRTCTADVELPDRL